MQRNITRNEVLAIVETYEGVLRQDMSNTEALARWTHWVYDDMRAALDSALAENARAERESLEAHDLLYRLLEVLNEDAETVLAADVRKFLRI